MPSPRVFRPRSSVAAVVVGGVLALAWAWSAMHDGGWLGLVRQAPSIVLAGTLSYGVLVRPAVEVGPAGVTLRNVVRDVVVPWTDLAEVRTRYALTLITTDGRRFTAWAAPASGRHTDTSLTRREVGVIGGDPDGDVPTASASTETSSGAAAAWIRREWSRACEPDGVARPQSAPAVRTRPARAVLAVLAVSAILTAAATQV